MAHGTTRARHPRGIARALGAALTLAGHAAAGQSAIRTTLDAGGGTVTIPGFARSTFTALGAHVAAERGRAHADALLSATRFETGHLASYGTLRGEVDRALTSRASVTVRGEAATGSYRGTEASRYARATARVDLRGVASHDARASDYGAWAETGGGWAHDVRAAGTLRSEIGAWRSYTWDARTLSVSATLAGVRADRAKYGELRGAARLLLAGGELDLGAGTRAGGRRWAQASAVAALTHTLAVVMSAGDDPPEPDRALVGSRALTLGLRWSTPTRAPTTADALLDPGRAVAAPFVVGAAASDGTRAVRVRLDAGAVELMADFTDWHPVALRRDEDGAWSARLPIAAGMHRVNVRVNGGEWAVPPGLPAADDDFGGRSGVLVVR